MLGKINLIYHFLSDNLSLGFIGGALLVGSLIALTVLAWKFTKINSVILFWIAFVLTRPFGATFGDLLTKPIAKGGLNLGTIGSSIVLASILLILIVFSYYKEKMLSRELTLNSTDLKY